MQTIEDLTGQPCSARTLRKTIDESLKRDNESLFMYAIERLYSRYRSLLPLPSFYLMEFLQTAAVYDRLYGVTECLHRMQINNRGMDSIGVYRQGGIDNTEQNYTGYWWCDRLRVIIYPGSRVQTKLSIDRESYCWSTLHATITGVMATFEITSAECCSYAFLTETLCWLAAYRHERPKDWCDRIIIFVSQIEGQLRDIEHIILWYVIESVIFGYPKYQGSAPPPRFSGLEPTVNTEYLAQQEGVALRR